MNDDIEKSIQQIVFGDCLECCKYPQSHVICADCILERLRNILAYEGDVLAKLDGCIQDIPCYAGCDHTLDEALEETKPRVAMIEAALATAQAEIIGLKNACHVRAAERDEAQAKGKASKNLAGYRIYWRLTTDAQWTSSRWVGKVTEYTLKNIVIDNYLFGVASVSNDGFESPVVFPDATGSFGE